MCRWRILMPCAAPRIPCVARRPVRMTGWWAASFGPCCPHHPVPSNRIFSRQVQIGRLCRDFATGFGSLWSLGASVVSGGDFGGPVSASKNPVPGGQGRAAGVRGVVRELDLGEIANDEGFCVPRYCGFKPSASNCLLHSAGASRSRSMLMPRGKRPSTAARTSLGARNASEMVMLT